VNAELIEEFRNYVQGRLDDLGDDCPFAQSDEALAACRELSQAMDKFESLFDTSRSLAKD